MVFSMSMYFYTLITTNKYNDILLLIHIILVEYFYLHVVLCAFDLYENWFLGDRELGTFTSEYDTAVF